jgi:copper chaperone CopZ
MQMNGRGPPLRSKHRERCPKCKERVKEFLEKIYGEVKTNYKFDLGTTPEDYRETPYYGRLLEIYRALQNYRGYRKFVKVSTIPRCDFFIPDPGFVVEFDESQHFTTPRKIALEHYPEIELGFDKIKWIMLCEKINARDNNPSYRDEQRAWYDTLRDFLPAIKGLRPTIRLFAGDLVWCRLNPNNPLDLEKFESFFKQCRGGWKIEVREDPKPQLARIIIAGKWDGNVDDAKKLLENVCARFPKRKKVKIILTCGGFMQFPWPENISPESVRDFKNPSSWVIRTLFDEAERRVRYLLSGGLDEKLKEITDYITLGIDSYKEKITSVHRMLNW